MRDGRAKRPLAAGSLAVLLLLATLATGLVVLPEGPMRVALALGLLWIAPTFFWFRRLDGPWIERLAAGCGIAFAAALLSAWLICTLPGPFSRPIFLAASLALAALPALWPSPGRETDGDQTSRRSVSSLLLVLFIAALIRLPGLGYKEFQGDEGIVMMSAARALEGAEEALLQHQKGPAEILVPAGVWALTGAINEAAARLPFTLAGLGALLAIAALAGRWFGPAVGVVAALIAGIEGFGTAFSRVVQYQTLVMLFGTLGVLMAARYRASGRGRDVIGCGAFLACGALAHYDAVLAFPAAAWLVLARLREAPAQERRSLWAAGALAAAILAGFYLPYVLAPSFGITARYLAQDRVGAGGPWSWSGGRVWQMATFYNSTWFAAGLGALGLVALASLARNRRAAAAALFALVPLAFYALVVADPRTHIYTAVPGLAILGAVGTGRLLPSATRRPSLRSAVLAAGLAWLLVCSTYVVLMFTDFRAERQRNWDTRRPWPALYPVTWPEPPHFGLFGFPYQAGWRALASAPPAMPFGSNEEAEVTGWYLPQGVRTYCSDLESFVQADRVQDEVPRPDGLSDMVPNQVITVGGNPRLTVSGRQQREAIEVNEAGRRQLWLRPVDVIPRSPDPSRRRGATFDGAIELAGYDLDPLPAGAGGEIWLTLYWRALMPIPESLQVFVHVYDGQMRAQADGAPGCGLWPTTRWRQGEWIRDPHRIALPPGLPAGEYPLLVGLYSLADGRRLGAQTPTGRTDTVQLEPLVVAGGPLTGDE
jgi:4-amino-4-deoxy-L-arabinose transferase-like glycosyltransferase